MRAGILAAFAILTTSPLRADLASIRGLIRAGRFAEAIADCDREIQAAPRSFALYTMKGLALHASGEKPGALTAFRQALAINPAYEPALKAASQIEFESRDPKAVQTVESLLRVDPSSDTANAMLASLLFDRHSCDTAIPHFEKAPAALQAPSMKWQYGVCLLVVQRWQDASAQFSALLQLRDHGPTRYNLALAQWNASDYRGAVSTLTPMETSGGDADAMRLLASAHESLGETAQALSVLQRAIQRDPGNEQILIDLAVLCIDHKALEVGLEVVRAGVQANPTSAKLKTLLGVLVVRNGDLKKGQELFEEAQRLSPDSGLGRIGLASLLMQMGMAAEAAKVLREQLVTGGPDARTELTLARALLQTNSSTDEKNQAAVLLQRVLKAEPQNAVAHGLLGKAYLQLGDTSKATMELSTAIRLDPADRASAYGLMTIYRQLGRSKEAADLAAKVRVLLDKEKADEDAGNRFRIVRENSPSN